MQGINPDCVHQWSNASLGTVFTVVDDVLGVRVASFWGGSEVAQRVALGMLELCDSGAVIGEHSGRHWPSKKSGYIEDSQVG